MMRFCYTQLVRQAHQWIIVVSTANERASNEIEYYVRNVHISLGGHISARHIDIQMLYEFVQFITSGHFLWWERIKVGRIAARPTEIRCQCSHSSTTLFMDRGGIVWVSVCGECSALVASCIRRRNAIAETSNNAIMSSPMEMNFESESNATLYIIPA